MGGYIDARELCPHCGQPLPERPIINPPIRPRMTREELDNIREDVSDSVLRSFREHMGRLLPGENRVRNQRVRRLLKQLLEEFEEDSGKQHG